MATHELHTVGTGQSTDKHDTVQVEDARMDSVDVEKYDSERVPEARGRESSDMPKGYFYSPKFIGAFCAIGFGFMAATGGYALIAPLLSDIDADIGPSANITW